MLEIQRAIGPYEYVKTTIDETSEQNIRNFEKLVDGLRKGSYQPKPEEKSAANALAAAKPAAKPAPKPAPPALAPAAQSLPAGVMACCGTPNVKTISGNNKFGYWEALKCSVCHQINFKTKDGTYKGWEPSNK